MMFNARIGNQRVLLTREELSALETFRLDKREALVSAIRKDRKVAEARAAFDRAGSDWLILTGHRLTEN